MHTLCGHTCTHTYIAYIHEGCNAWNIPSLLNSNASLLNSNALPPPRPIHPDIATGGPPVGPITTSIIRDRNALVVGGKGPTRPVGIPAGPLYRAGRGVCPAGDPGAQLDLHGRLGESPGGGCLGFGVAGEQGTDGPSIDGPGDFLARPLDGIGMGGGHGVGHGVELAAVVGGGVALAEVVGLHASLVASNPFPVDLVEAGLVRFVLLGEGGFFPS